MLQCGHPGEPQPARLCAHAVDDETDNVIWYIGRGMDHHILCTTCAEDPTGAPLQTSCSSCYRDARWGVFGKRGSPEVKERLRPIEFSPEVKALSPGLPPIIDFVPLGDGSASNWLLLGDDGTLTRLDGQAGTTTLCAQSSVPDPPPGSQVEATQPARRLHASRCGAFAAVVQDRGQRGEVMDLKSGKSVFELACGDYYPEQVPFSLAFIEREGRSIVVHRTDWNRLDWTDASTGECLTTRGPTRYERGEERPPHYLDYFHGGLLVSPRGSHIADDGWGWHPYGLVRVWSLDAWAGNVWESENGASAATVTGAAYYWDRGLTWIEDDLLAVGGLGDDDDWMTPGVSFFRIGGSEAEAPKTFAGPDGLLFSDGSTLYSSDDAGLARWDMQAGLRTGLIPGFSPKRRHPGTGELAAVVDHTLVRWRDKA